MEAPAVPKPRRGQVPKVELAKREADVARLANEGKTTRQIAAELGYADHSGAARAIRRIMARYRSAEAIDAKKYQQRIVSDLDEAREQLFEVAEDTEDERVRVRALAAITNNAVATGHATGAIKLPPPVQFNQSLHVGPDLSKLAPNELLVVHEARRLLEGVTPKPEPQALPESTSKESEPAP